MNIQVFGSGCATCKTLYKNVQDIVAKLGLDTEVQYSTDIAEIVTLGVMSSPVLVINSKVVASGHMPSNEEIEQLILNQGTVENGDPSCGCSCGGN